MSVTREQAIDFAQKVQNVSNEPINLCYQCGTCTAACPMNVPVRRLIRSSQLGLKDITIDNKDLWSCSTCRICELYCPRGVKITEILHALRIMSYDAKKSPKKLDEALWGVYEDGNPWKGKKADRAKWAEGLDVRTAGAITGGAIPTAKTKAKYLLYVGCAASFDPRLQKIARSLVRILNKAGVDYAILGDKESCCGDVIYNIGEEGFLEELVQNNLKDFEKTGAECVVSISPHCYNMFKTVYPKYGNAIPSHHYTELLSELIDKDALKISSSASSSSSSLVSKTPSGAIGGKLEVTYHDPCYLGRYHGIYEEPRKILESLPHTALVEMKDTKGNALCCGGGGGQMWMDSIGERQSHQRIMNAAESGASIMATSCPYCVQNFEDAAKTKSVRDVRVMDVAEMVEASLEK